MRTMPAASPCSIPAPGLRRRQLVSLGLLGALPFVNPSTGPDGRAWLIRPAEAVWLQVAALALSAISAFSKHGDGGVGAYLQNIKELTEENIRLTQGVLVGIGQIQSQLETMPERMRQIFIEVKGYELKQGTQTALDKLLLIESRLKKNRRLDSSDRRECQLILDSCAEMTGARSAPYGRGGTAAASIALIGSIEARASWFLHRSDNFRRRVSIAYLPWFEQIFLDQDGSLQRLFIAEGSELVRQGESALNGLPDGMKGALAATWKQGISTDPGGGKLEATIACGSFANQTGTRLGDCTDYMCMRNEVLSNPGTQKLLSAIKDLEVSEKDISQIQARTAASRSSLSSVQSTDLSNATPEGRDRCFCTKREAIPIYTPQTGAGYVASVSNEMIDGAPQMRLTTEWRQQEPAACPVFVNGNVASKEGQFASAKTSAGASEVNKRFQAFVDGDLAKFNSQRAIVYATYLLLDAARGAHEQFRRVAT